MIKSTLSLLVLAALAIHTTAAPPPILNHQGRIAVGGTNFDGTGYFKFAIVNGSGSIAWTNSVDAIPRDGEPDDAVPVTVRGGHYALLLGDTDLTNMNPLSTALFEVQPELHLRVWISPKTGENRRSKQRIRNVYCLGLHMRGGDDR